MKSRAKPNTTLTDPAALATHQKRLADYRDKHNSLRKQGVVHSHRYSLVGDHRCAVCDSKLKPGDIIRTDMKKLYMHRDVTVCAGVNTRWSSADRSPLEQEMYIAGITGGVKKAERLLLKPPGGFDDTPHMWPERVPTWQKGVCTVTPDGEVVMPDQQPVALLPAHAQTPIHVPVEVDVLPIMQQINERWLQDHGVNIRLRKARPSVLRTSPHKWGEFRTTSWSSLQPLLMDMAGS